MDTITLARQHLRKRPIPDHILNNARAMIDKLDIAHLYICRQVSIIYYHILFRYPNPETGPQAAWQAAIDQYAKCKQETS